MENPEQQGQAPPPMPPQYIPPQPPSQDKKKAWITFGIVLGALIIIGLIVGPMMRGGVKETAEETTTTSQTEEKTTTTKPPATTTPAPAPAPPPKAWQNVINMTASNSKKSDTFQITSSQQKMLYSVSGDPAWTVCGISIISPAKGYPDEMIVIDEPETSESMLYLTPGTYYLDLNIANCTVEVTIQEMK